MLHRGFSSRNEPITRASSGEVQKHSTASRGVQTIGSPRVLNEVFISTGTPVAPLKRAHQVVVERILFAVDGLQRAVPSTCRTAGMRSALSGRTS